MTYSRRDIISARLTLVRRELDYIAGKLTPGILEWAPSQGMRTIAGQFVEIISTEMLWVSLLKTDTWTTDDENLKVVEACRSLDSLRQAMKDVRAETLEMLNSLSDDDLAEEVVFRGGTFNSLELPTIPRGEILVNIAFHEWYHAGQLTSYLWARGDDPYK